MRNGLFRKGFVLGIILFFVASGLSSLVTANNIDTESKDETKDFSNDSGVSDDYKEIITLIMCNANLNWICRRGIFRGEVEIDATFFGGKNWLVGLRRANGKVEPYFRISQDIIHPYFFRGFYYKDLSIVIGYALGNIEW